MKKFYTSIFCTFVSLLLFVSCAGFAEGLMMGLSSMGSMYGGYYPSYGSSSYSSGNSSSYSSSSSSSYSSSSNSSSYSSNSSSKSCSSLKINNGKWYCANTGRCGMCNGSGYVKDGYGLSSKHKCTLCGGSGKCKYCN